MSAANRAHGGSGGDWKDASSGSRPPGPEAKRTRPLEVIVLLHTAILLLWLTWDYGGGREVGRIYFAWWGSLGLLITLTAIQDRTAWREGWLTPLYWLAPLLLFNGLVLLACLNPTLREIKYGAESVLVVSGGRAGWPSSARPEAALRALWLFDALYLSAFNLLLVVRRRRTLRTLLLVASISTVTLSVLGTVQKLAHAKGPYFDERGIKQTYFFSTFIYHNHWGAFALLMLAAGLGLTWYFARRFPARNALHSPAIAGLAAALLVAATLPLSGSRSSTLLALPLLGGAFAHWIWRMVKTRRRYRESVVAPLLGGLAALILSVAGIWYLARDTIDRRVALTHSQVTTMLQQGSVGSRATLYADTWRMAREKPAFGWGMASYPHVFQTFNSQVSRADRLPIFYRDAHSDWLQALAEHGFIGTALLALCALLPLTGVRVRHLRHPIPGYLLTGCGLVLAYAWIEFPFGNLAVVFCWWLCFFCAVHYLRLQEREKQAASRDESAL